MSNGNNKAIGIWKNRLVAMYHRSTHRINTEYVFGRIPKQDSAIRFLFATIAFGMGLKPSEHSRHLAGSTLWMCTPFERFRTRNWHRWKGWEASTLYHSQNLSKVQSAENMKTFLNEKDLLADTPPKILCTGNHGRSPSVADISTLVKRLRQLQRQL